MDGTSMAAPHVTGSIALIKQLHPNWTPAMLQASLMNTAKDLGLSPFAQGAGREQVNEAVKAKILMMPGSLSLGVDDLRQSVWITATTFQVQNISTSSVNYSLSVSGTLPSGISVTLEPSSVSLVPGATTTVTFRITVDNSVVPFPSEAPYAYSGMVVAQSGGDRLTLPFAFVKSPSLQITFDQVPWYVRIHDRVSKSWSFPNPPNRPLGTSLTAILPPGNYDVITVFPEYTWVVKEGVIVSSLTPLAVNSTDAIYTVRIVPKDKNGLAIVDSFQMTQHLQLKGSIFYNGFNLYSKTNLDFKISPLSANYAWEWSANPLSTSEFYAFNGVIANGIAGDLTFQNAQGDLKHVTYRFRPDPIKGQLYISPWVGNGPNCGWTFANPAIGRTILPPFVQEAYLMPPPYPGFSYGYVNLDIYDQNVNTSPSATLLATTPYLFASSNTEIKGYLHWETDYPVFTTTSQFLDWQLSPPHWFGRFQNQAQEVRLKAAKGALQWLYRQQRQDLRPYINLPYELYQGGTLVQSGTIPSARSALMDPPISIPLPGAGRYTLTIPYAQYYIGGRQGTARMTAEFDTSKVDGNPPTLLSLNILANGEPSDVVGTATSGQVRFVVEDDMALNSVSLYYNATGGWQSLSLASSNSEFLATLPSLSDGTYVALKLVAQDAAGNVLTYEANPALLVSAQSTPTATPTTTVTPTPTGTPTTTATPTPTATPPLQINLPLILR
jgi:hypothetical protein